mmetsp:Transcript_13730/g.20236  ORF Transcript_13730/g.20236 Transcript_13730/m.20236 type:complete len:144 (+) Transcript_13730:520-951(+)
MAVKETPVAALMVARIAVREIPVDFLIVARTAENLPFGSSSSFADACTNAKREDDCRSDTALGATFLTMLSTGDEYGAASGTKATVVVPTDIRISEIRCIVINFILQVTRDSKQSKTTIWLRDYCHKHFPMMSNTGMHYSTSK